MCGGRTKSPSSSSPSLFSGGGAATSEDGEDDGDDEVVAVDGSGASTSDCFGDETGLFDGVGAWTGSEIGVGA